MLMQTLHEKLSKIYKLTELRINFEFYRLRNLFTTKLNNLGPMVSNRLLGKIIRIWQWFATLCLKFNNQLLDT